MGQSKLMICNQALLKIGQQGLTSLDEGSDASKLCETFFDQAFEETLREYPWNCATKRAKLVNSSESPLFGYSNAFVLPADYIRILQVYDGSGNFRQEYRWEIEDGKLLTNMGSIFVKYIYNIEDTLKLDALSTSAVVCKLALKMAFSRTGSRKLSESIQYEYEQLILPRARSIDTQENKSIEENNLGSWLTTRR